MLPLLQAAPTPLGVRIAVAAALVALGAYLVIVGRQNIATGVAEETGKRRAVNAALGKENVYTGKKAAWMGWARIAMGVACFVFAVVFLVYGAFLAP